MGTGDVELTAEALRQLFALDPTAKRLNLTDMGDGVYFCRIASALLPLGYHGSVDAILENNCVMFRRTCDT
jgi:hypothetical protein